MKSVLFIFFVFICSHTMAADLVFMEKTSGGYDCDAPDSKPAKDARAFVMQELDPSPQAYRQVSKMKIRIESGCGKPDDWMPGKVATAAASFVLKSKFNERWFTEGSTLYFPRGQDTDSLALKKAIAKATAQAVDHCPDPQKFRFEKVLDTGSWIAEDTHPYYIYQAHVRVECLKK